MWQINGVKIMNTRPLRLLLAALVLCVLFFIDAWMNVKTKIGIGFLTWIGFGVAFHMLVFEAVFTKSKPLVFAIWIVVAICACISFLVLDNPMNFFIVVVFFVGYTALLMLYLDRILR
jgi:FtsH-binding integral membrane protein